MRVTFFGIHLIKEQIILIIISRIVFTVKIQPRCRFAFAFAIGPKIEKIAARLSATGSHNSPACVTTFVGEQGPGGSGLELDSKVSMLSGGKH
jgi:hypothetical protein